MSQPNILLIHSDQHRFDCLGVNGHPVIRTPHLDGLAAQGMNFTQAHTPAPVCTPARNSLLYGVWPSTHLAIANPGTEAPRGAAANLPTFSKALRDAGYTMGLVGRWSVDPHKPPTNPENGFHRYIPDKTYLAWRAGLGLPSRPHTNSWFGEVDPYIAAEQSWLAWGADQTLSMLEEAAGRQRPFFIRWDPGEPHLPNIVPEPYASLYDPSAIPPWPSFPDSFEGKPYIQAQQLRTWKLTDWGWDKWAPVVARYLGEISLLDAQVGRLLDGLERLGIAGETIVIYTTDHGDLCGGHGMIDKHFVMYDDVVRVPLIVRWPGRIAPGRVCDAFVCHGIDLAATLCELAGAEAPATFQGRSMLPLFKGALSNGRTDILSMYHGSQFGLYSQRMVRDKRWKYVWNATAEDELYDLASDPGELCNLALDPACQTELRRLRQRLVVWMEEIRDPLLNGWTRAQLLEGLSR